MESTVLEGQDEFITLSSKYVNIRMEISNNPLDDYQRTVFSQKNNKNDTIIGPGPSRLSKRVYHTKLAQNIRKNPLLEMLSCKPCRLDLDLNGQRNSLNEAKLHCLEYEVPNIIIESVYGSSNKMNSECTTPQNKNYIKFGTGEVSKATSGMDSKQSNNWISSKHNILNGRVLSSNYYPGGNKITEGSDIEREILQNKSNYESEKDKHNKVGDNTLLTSNCAIIWSENTNFVFMTGIWKLYQRVMNGLVSMDRRSEAGNDKRKLFCLEEWNKTITNIFGKKSILHTHSQDLLNNTLGTTDGRTRGGLKTADRTNENNVKYNDYTIKYFDFKWEIVDSQIREKLLTCFKRYVVQNENINPEMLQCMDSIPLAQKVRGGRIRIQGTWLPIYLAHQLCIIFAYPIRYLLIPVFGSTFPKECEDWYRSNEDYDKQNASYINTWKNTDTEMPHKFKGIPNLKGAIGDHSVTNNKYPAPAQPIVVSLTDRIKYFQYPQIAHNSENQHSYVQLPSGLSTVLLSSNVCAPLQQPSRCNNYFQLEKKSSKIEKAPHHNNLQRERLPSINNILIPELKSQSFLSTGRIDKHQTDSMHSISSAQYFTSNNRRTAILPQQLRIRNPTHFTQQMVNEANIPNMYIPYYFHQPELGNIVYSGTQYGNNMVSSINYHPIQYNYVPYQYVTYVTPMSLYGQEHVYDSNTSNSNTITTNQSSPNINVNNNATTVFPQGLNLGDQ